jgi:predicted metal-dependent hydrolase
MSNLPTQYLRGIELFNAGRFFESHEAFEEIWLKAEGTERDFLHALIQTAAALHHLRRGNQTGAKSVFERARRKFKSLPPIVMKLDTVALAQELEQFFLAAYEPDSGKLPLPQIKLQEQQ